MTGEEAVRVTGKKYEMPEPMELSAVTICINYSDYLGCVIENRRHFDRWVIITVPGDRATHELCAENEIECFDSRILSPGGQDFDAAVNKGAVLNEVLRRLPVALWTLVLDADILLPRHFRKRVEALPLEIGCLYGVAGRRICQNRDMFEMLKVLEPWSQHSSRHGEPIGYFNLFSPRSEPNLYPERGADKFAHDDWLFTRQFDPSRRRVLPMEVLHGGPVRKNWSGRSTEPFGPRESTKPLNTPLDFLTKRESELNGLAAIVGYYPGNRWASVADQFSESRLIDHFQIDAPSGYSMLEADRSVLRGLFREEFPNDRFCLGSITLQASRNSPIAASI